MASKIKTIIKSIFSPVKTLVVKKIKNIAESSETKEKVLSIITKVIATKVTDSAIAGEIAAAVTEALFKTINEELAKL